MVQGSDILCDEVERTLRFEYLHGHKDRTSKTLDKIRQIIVCLQEPHLPLMGFLQDVADTINGQLWVKEVTIGLRDPDGKYRFKVMCGLRADRWASHKQMAFTKEEFSDPEIYKGRQLTKDTLVFLAEDEPYVDEEMNCFTRAVMLNVERTSAADYIEGDYFDTHIYGENDEIIGWIEYGGMKDGKFPDGTTVRWIELLASIIRITITRKNRGEENHPAKSRARSFIPFVHDR